MLILILLGQLRLFRIFCTPSQLHNIYQTDPSAGMCFLLYTGGDEEKLSCMARAACESPVAADNYLAAAKLWYKMHKLIQVLYCTAVLYCTVLYCADSGRPLQHQVHRHHGDHLRRLRARQEGQSIHIYSGGRK